MILRNIKKSEVRDKRSTLGIHFMIDLELLTVVEMMVIVVIIIRVVMVVIINRKIISATMVVGATT